LICFIRISFDCLKLFEEKGFDLGQVAMQNVFADILPGLWTRISGKFGTNVGDDIFNQLEVFKGRFDGRRRGWHRCG
jgi:hypothetical protein